MVSKPSTPWLCQFDKPAQQCGPELWPAPHVEPCQKVLTEVKHLLVHVRGLQYDLVVADHDNMTEITYPSTAPGTQQDKGKSAVPHTMHGQKPHILNHAQQYLNAFPCVGTSWYVGCRLRWRQSRCCCGKPTSRPLRLRLSASSSSRNCMMPWSAQGASAFCSFMLVLHSTVLYPACMLEQLIGGTSCSTFAFLFTTFTATLVTCAVHVCHAMPYEEG